MPTQNANEERNMGTVVGTTPDESCTQDEKEVIEPEVRSSAQHNADDEDNAEVRSEHIATILGTTSDESCTQDEKQVSEPEVRSAQHNADAETEQVKPKDISKTGTLFLAKERVAQLSHAIQISSYCTRYLNCAG